MRFQSLINKMKHVIHLSRIPVNVTLTNYDRVKQV